MYEVCLPSGIIQFTKTCALQLYIPDRLPRSFEMSRFFFRYQTIKISYHRLNSLDLPQGPCTVHNSCLALFSTNCA